MTRLPLLPALLLVAVSFSACTSSAVSTRRTPVPASTATPEVGFSVAVTPGAHPRATPRAAATATQFTPPATAWLQLIPDRGYSVASTLRARGGNLPPASPIELIWAEHGTAGPVIRTAVTGTKGGLDVTFPVPASPPGEYVVSVASGTLPLATARYTVVSGGYVWVRVRVVNGAHRLTVEGRGFRPNQGVLFGFSPFSGSERSRFAYSAHTDGSGRFAAVILSRTLTPGQYLLTVESARFLVPVAQTVFQVVV